MQLFLKASYGKPFKSYKISILNTFSPILIIMVYVINISYIFVKSLKAMHYLHVLEYMNFDNKNKKIQTVKFFSRPVYQYSGQSVSKEMQRIE